MSDTVLVRSSLRNWDFVLLLLAGGLVVGLGMFIVGAGGVGPGLALSGVGVFLVVAAIIGWVVRVARRRWARDTGDGFVLIDSRGEREVRDEDVLTLSILYKNHHSGGVLKEQTRVFCVWLAGPQDRPEKVELATRFKLGANDPLAGLMNRLSTRLFEQANQDLRDGHAVLGEFWEWRKRELIVREKRETKECSIKELAAVEVIDGKVCAWQRDQDEVWARVPQGSANAYLLQQLIEQELARRPPEGPPPAGHLGRILFERHQRRHFPVAVGMTILLGFFGLIVVVGGLALGGGPPAVVIGLILLGIGFVTGWYAAWCRVATFRCHQYGVCKRGLFGERTLPYVEVGAFTYSATRLFVNGVYSGTTLGLKFEPVEDGPTIGYGATIQNPDQALDNLRDHVARVVAARMASELREGESVAWTPQLRFRPKGLLCKPAGWFGSKEEELIPYTEIGSYDIQEGHFYIWVRGEKKPIVKEATSTRNFFPGYFLLLTILHAAQE